MSGNQDLRTKLDALRRGALPQSEIYDTVHEFGHALLLEAEPEVAALLKDPNPDLRYLAINVLTLHWDRRDYRHVLEKMMFEDPNPDVRDMAATGLGFSLRGSRDMAATRLFISKLRDPNESAFVKGGVYEALLDLWFSSPTEIDAWYARYFPERLSLDNVKKHHWSESIDWDLVKAVESGHL